jgi:peroxiredoxin
MDAPAAMPTTTAAAPRRTRLTTLAVMGVTAVVIIAVAFVVNQPTTTASGLTDVTLTGTPAGAAPTVGQPAPDFSALAVYGEAVKLSDLKGQPVWLTFGASWCQPCRAENPDVKATAEKHAANGLVVLQVFMAEDAAAVKDYADRVGLAYTKIPDPTQQLATDYRILGIPTHFFIDRDGVLQQMKIGSLDVAAMDAAVGQIGG